MFRRKLHHIVTQSELWEYFEKYARYHEQSGQYCLWDIFDQTLEGLMQKVEKVWKYERFHPDHTLTTEQVLALPA